MDFLLAAVGIAILLVAGDYLVRGAVNGAVRLGLPPLVVALTVVAFGTSAPELLVSVDAVLRGAPSLALGNVVGSNIANVLLVLGIPAIISRLASSAHDVRQSYVQMLAATAVFIALALTGPIVWTKGLVLLAGLGLILGLQARSAMKARNGGVELDGLNPDIRWPRILLFLAVGLVGLPLGADIFVNASIGIARTFGVSEAVIGLTLVALGTSLPELATTVIAAWRRQADVALGNVIGSNLFNLLGIVGLASLFGDIPVDPDFVVYDFWVMAATSVLLAWFVFSKSRDITRRWGVLLVAIYAAYILSLVV